MASKAEIMQQILSVLRDYSGKFYESSLSSPEDILKSNEMMSLKVDLGLREGEMYGIYSEFQDAFGIDLGDFLDSYLPTVGDLVKFILSRVAPD